MSKDQTSSSLDPFFALALEKDDENSSPINNNTYYQRVLPQLSKGKIFSWNWSAFFFTYWWFLYRRMYFLSFLTIFLLAPLIFIENIYPDEMTTTFLHLSIIILHMGLCGLLGNWFYYKSLLHRLRQGYLLISPPATDIFWVYFWIFFGASFFPLALMIVLLKTILSRRQIAVAKRRLALPLPQL